MAFYDKKLRPGEREKLEENELLSRSKPNRAYHSFFEGWSEVRVPRKNGRGTTIRRVYTMPYIRQDVPDRAWRINKLAAAGGYAAALGLFLLPALRRLPGNAAAYVAIPGVLSILGLFLTFVALASLLIRPRRMTVWEYRSGPKRFAVLCIATASCLGCTALALAVFLFLNPEAERGAHLLCAMGYAASGIVLALCSFREHRLPYAQVENTNTRLEGSVDIS